MSDPIRSFTARVINLCYAVRDTNELTDLKALHDIAKVLEEEAIQLQSIFGGRPAGKERKKKNV